MKPTSDFPLAESKKVADEFEHFLNHSSTEKSEWNESMENLLKLFKTHRAHQDYCYCYNGYYRCLFFIRIFF